VFLLSFVAACTRDSDQRLPIEIVRSVADRLIEDSDFAFEMVPQNEVLGLQVLDFESIFCSQTEPAIYYASGYIIADRDTTILLGLSYNGKIKIRLNGEVVYFGNEQKQSLFKEIAYNIIEFQHQINLNLKKGSNHILIKSAATGMPGTVFLRAMTPEYTEEKSVEFSIGEFAAKIADEKWLYTGPFPLQDNFQQILPPESQFKPYYLHKGVIYTWKRPASGTLLRLKKNPASIFQEKSHVDWRYDNGAAAWTMFRVAEATGDQKYFAFLKKYCDFTLENLPYFKWQYEKLHAFRGSYHKYFRLTMLDDSGGPALPFLYMAINENDKKYTDFLEPIATYVSEHQSRLEDGTFCRPEPEKMTIWADDLFMSVPFLLGYSKISGDPKYRNDAVLQVLNFTKYLYNHEKGIFHHGWYSSSGENSSVFWGRSNGWIIWAVSELLLDMQKKHPDYAKIITIYRNHVTGLLKYQDKNGSWHQVLDYPSSYEETSCTAMFVMAIARGINNGWIGREHEDAALLGWQRLKSKINPDGSIYGTCTGTGMSNSMDFYLTRPKFDNDPRGIGATLLAGIEIQKLN
ncbi:MAG: hypothetical protein GQ561_08405, partial [Calditrichae bacterium]|nr:hypothetical protein [Calditrichia bacterium]